MVLVSDPDATCRRRWLRVLRDGGLAVRGASGGAERAKALADGLVALELTSDGTAGAPTGGMPARLVVPAHLPDDALLARVRAALASGRP